jgi:hypothetical protein
LTENQHPRAWTPRVAQRLLNAYCINCKKRLDAVVKFPADAGANRVIVIMQPQTLESKVIDDTLFLRFDGLAAGGLSFRHPAPEAK